MPWHPFAVFCVSAALVGYVLAGYPICLWLLNLRQRQPPARRWLPRTVSILIPVHNGEAWIEEKLRSIEGLQYPPHLLQLILIDDGSTDATAALITRHAGARAELIRLPRGGKAAALNAGMRRATGEILFFTDVRQRLDPGCLEALIESLGDDSVGVVSGELVILSGTTRQEADIGLYWRYEKWIRKQQSRLGCVPGATGSVYAMRRELAVPLPAATLLDDVYLPMAAAFRGRRVILDERARAFDRPTALDSEFRRKVRTQAGVYQIAAAYPQLLLPTNRMWFHFVSHKAGRLLLPFLLILIAFASWGLPPRLRAAAVGTQALVYALAAMDGIIREESPVKRATSITRTFVVLLAAALCAPWFWGINGRRRGAGWTVTEVRMEKAPPQG